MLAMPLAICGCFVMLFLGHKTLDIFSMIGMVMLMGVAVKNSILLVDYAGQLIARAWTEKARSSVREKPDSARS